MIIKLHGLVCYANETPICKPINLNATPGNLVLLEGANGAGKSTIMRALAGILRNITGTIECTEQVCYIGHENTLHDNLTVLENLCNNLMLEIGAKISDLEPINKVLTTIKLANKKHCYPWQLSQGQRHKLNLAKLLLTPHRIWLLDEPLVHLDLEMQDFFLNTIQQNLVRNLGIVVLTSHTPVLLPKCKVIKLCIN